MAHTQDQEKGVFFNVMADGKFHKEVPEGTENAVLREGDTKDGKHYAKWELLYSDVSGIITKVELYDGSYGMNLNLTIEDEGYETIVASFKTDSNFGEDMLRKLLSIDRSQPVKLVPYAFEPEKGSMKRGVTVYQNGEKIQSYFHDYDTETKKSTPKNGLPDFPKPKGKKTELSKDEKKMVYTQQRLHMINTIQDALGLDNTADAEAEAERKFNGE